MSRQVRPHWSVKVCKPRKDEGARLRLRVRPNAPLIAAGHRERRLAVDTTDPAVAATMAKEWERKLNASFGGHDRLTVSQVFDKHLAWREVDPDGNPSTTSTYRLAFRHLSSAIGGVLAYDVSETVVVRAQEHLRRVAGLSPRTVNLHMRCAGAAWEWATKKGLVRVPWVKPESLKARDGTKRSLTPWELEAFFEWLAGHQGGRWTAFFKLLANTSCRVSEIRHLREGRLDRSEGVLIVDSHRAHDGSKRNKAVGVDPEDAALVPLRAHGELLFPSFTGDAARPVSREQVRRVLKTWAKQALPDPETIDTHSLRRTCISHLRRAGVPDAVGQRQAGIKNTRIYTDYDRNTVDDDLRLAIRKLKEYRQRAVTEHREKLAREDSSEADNDTQEEPGVE